MTDAPLPLPADQVDELLSAELDGEFDAAARDFDLEPDEARARLAATPSVDARRAALTRARDMLAELPPIDELMAARLRAKATRAGDQESQQQDRARRARRWQRMLVVSGAVAAAAAVVVGIVVTTRNTSNREKTSESNAAAAAPSHAPAPAQTGSGATQQPAVDFGNVPDVQTLAARVETRAKAPQTFSNDRAAGASTSTPPSSGVSVVQSGEPKAAASAATPIVVRCDVTARQFAGVTSAAVAIVRGVANVGGVQVVVELYAKEKQQVLVVLTTDCRLVNLQTSPAAG